MESSLRCASCQCPSAHVVLPFHSGTMTPMMGGVWVSPTVVVRAMPTASHPWSSVNVSVAVTVARVSQCGIGLEHYHLIERIHPHTVS